MQWLLNKKRSRPFAFLGKGPGLDSDYSTKFLSLIMADSLF